MTTYHVDAAQVSAATQTVQGTIGRIQAEVASLLGQLTGLQSSWSGQAATAFQGAVSDWRSTQLHVEQSLAQLNRALWASPPRSTSTPSRRTRGSSSAEPNGDSADAGHRAVIRPATIAAMSVAAARADSK